MGRALQDRRHFRRRRRIGLAHGPKQEQQRQSRGAACGATLSSPPNSRDGSLPRQGNGKVGWETTFPDIASVVITQRRSPSRTRSSSAPPTVGRHPRLDRGSRCGHRQARVAEIHRAGAGEPVARPGKAPTMPGRPVARGLGHWHVDRTPTRHLGNRQPGADVPSDLPAGRQPYTNSASPGIPTAPYELVFSNIARRTSGTSTRPEPTS